MTLLKSYTSYLLILITGLALACKDDEEEIFRHSCIVQKETFTGGYRTYAWDSQNRIAEVKRFDEQDFLLRHHTYVYEGRSITLVDNIYGRDRRYEFNEKNQLIREVQQNPDGQYIKYFLYKDNTPYFTGISESENGPPFVEIEWDNGNIVTEQGNFTFEFEYDTRINPFYGSIIPGKGWIEIFSKNNVVSISSSQYTEENEFTYNEREYPVSVTSTQSEALLGQWQEYVVEKSLEYECR